MKYFSQDILHHWAHPLSIESGSFYQNNYVSMGYQNFRKKTSVLSRYSLNVDLLDNLSRIFIICACLT